MKLFLTLCAVGAAIVFVLVPRRFALVLPVAVLVYLFLFGRSLEHQMRATSGGVLVSGITVRREWIDERVGPEAQVAALVTGATNPRIVPEDEFFNRSLHPVYVVGLPAPRLAVAVESRVGRRADRRVERRLGLADLDLIRAPRTLRSRCAESRWAPTRAWG